MHVYLRSPDQQESGKSRHNVLAGTTTLRVYTPAGARRLPSRWSIQRQSVADRNTDVRKTGHFAVSGRAADIPEKIPFVRVSAQFVNLLTLGRLTIKITVSALTGQSGRTSTPPPLEGEGCPRPNGRLFESKTSSFYVVLASYILRGILTSLSLPRYTLARLSRLLHGLP